MRHDPILHVSSVSHQMPQDWKFPSVTYSKFPVQLGYEFLNFRDAFSFPILIKKYLWEPWMINKSMEASVKFKEVHHHTIRQELRLKKLICISFKSMAQRFFGEISDAV